ncbi:MAG: T9SS type A sorting domain-containing protein [Prevotellaceae bacterium]|jgi:hypothetical protein|nr:T9SS type A sorting domain-containing protein [Prevotellaceae bacterium]
MKTTLLKMNVIVVLFLTITNVSDAANFQSRADGNWNGTAVWQKDGVNTTETPTATDNVVINNTVTVSNSINPACANLTINAGKTLAFSGNSTSVKLVVNGDLTVNGTLGHKNGNGIPIEVYGNFVLNGTYQADQNPNYCLITMKGNGGTHIKGTNLGSQNLYYLTIDLNSNDAVVYLDNDIQFGNQNNAPKITLTKGIFNAQGYALKFTKYGAISLSANGKFASPELGCQYTESTPPSVITTNSGSGADITLSGVGVNPVMPVRNLTPYDGNIKFPNNANATIIMYGTYDRKSTQMESNGTWVWGANSHYKHNGNTSGGTQPSNCTAIANGPKTINSVANANRVNATVNVSGSRDFGAVTDLPANSTVTATGIGNGAGSPALKADLAVTIEGADAAAFSIISGATGGIISKAAASAGQALGLRFNPATPENRQYNAVLRFCGGLLPAALEFPLTAFYSSESFNLITAGTATLSNTAPCVGNNITLSVSGASIDGDASLLYQWYKTTGTTNNGGTAIAGATAATYTYNVSDNTAYRFYCELTDNTNASNKKSSAVSEVIATKAVTAISTPLVNANIHEFSPTNTFTVTATGANLTYSWYKDGAVISGATSASYTANAAGTYEVRVSGDCGAVQSSSAVLTYVEGVLRLTQMTEPMYIRNYWHTGNSSSNWKLQYLFDDGNGGTANTGVLKAYVRTTASDELPESHQWIVEKIAIYGTEYGYLLKNIATGRYLYQNNAANGNASLRPLQGALLATATGVDGSSEANKELSYYLHEFPKAGFDILNVTETNNVSGIMSKRYTAKGKLLSECGSCNTAADGSTPTVTYSSNVNNDEASSLTARWWEFYPKTVAPLTDPEVTPAKYNCGLTLSWTGDRQTNVANYKVYLYADACNGAPIDSITLPAATKTYTFPAGKFTLANSPKTVNYAVRAFSSKNDASHNYDSPGIHCGTISVSCEEMYVPELISAAARTNDILLTWTKMSDADVYNVYRSSATDTAAYTKIAEVVATAAATQTYADKSAMPGVTYYYRVSYIKSTGSESDKSNRKSAQITLTSTCTTTAFHGTVDNGFTDNSSTTPWQVGEVILARNYDKSTGCAYQTNENGTNNPRTDSGSQKPALTAKGALGKLVSNTENGEYLYFTIEIPESKYYTLTAKALASCGASVPMVFDVQNFNFNSAISAKAGERTAYVVGAGENEGDLNETSTGQIYLEAGVYKLKVTFGGNIYLHSVSVKASTNDCLAVMSVSGGNAPKISADTASWSGIAAHEFRYPVRINGRDASIENANGTLNNGAIGEWKMTFDEDYFYFNVEVDIRNYDPQHKGLVFNNLTPTDGGRFYTNGDGIEFYFAYTDAGGNAKIHQTGFVPQNHAAGVPYHDAYIYGYYWAPNPDSTQVGVSNYVMYNLDKDNDGVLDAYILNVKFNRAFLRLNNLSSLNMELAVSIPWRTGSNPNGRRAQISSFPKAVINGCIDGTQMFQKSGIYTNLSLMNADIAPQDISVGVTETAAITFERIRNAVQNGATIEWKRAGEPDNSFQAWKGDIIIPDFVSDESYVFRAVMPGCQNIASKVDINLNIDEIVDTIIWTNREDDSSWSNRKNWLNPKTGSTVNKNSMLSDSLTVIIPAPACSKYTYCVYENGQIVRQEGIGTVRDSVYPSVCSEAALGDIKGNCGGGHYFNKLIVEYGGATYIKPFVRSGIAAHKYHSAEIEMVVSDRNEWILVGANVKPFNGRNDSIMQSGNYYLNREPNVYMRELTIGEDGASSDWQASFPNLNVDILPEKCFAIKIPDDYGASKQKASVYYKYIKPNPALRETAGTAPVTFTFTGKLGNCTATLPLENTGGKFKIECNTFMANISVTRLLQALQSGGVTAPVVAVWSFNNPQTGGAGSFTTYSLSGGSLYPAPACGTDVYIKPMHAFMYICDRALSIDEEDICVVNSVSTRYRAPRADNRQPTLQITAKNGKYASNAYIIYNETETTTQPKLFTSAEYAAAPDVFIVSDDKKVQTQTIASLYDEVAVGVKLGAETAQATFTFAGADEFEEAYFIDKATNTTYDLLSVDSLTVDISKGLNADRFVVKFRLEPPVITVVGAKDISPDTKIYTEDNQRVVISAKSEIRSINVFNINGSLLLTETPNTAYRQLDLSAYPANVYIVKAETDLDSKAEKIVIR